MNTLGRVTDSNQGSRESLGVGEAYELGRGVWAGAQIGDPGKSSVLGEKHRQMHRTH